MKTKTVFQKTYNTLLVVLFMSCSPSVNALPYEPQLDQFVVLEVAQNFSNQGMNEDGRKIVELRQRLQNNKNEPQFAVQLAKIYIRLAQNNNDPRYYGLAEAVIKPWWNTNIDKQLLMIKMSILQFNHQFRQALRTLEQVENMASYDTQVSMQRANLYRLMGEYALSKVSCEFIRLGSAHSSRMICLAAITGLSLSAEKARELTRKLHAVVQFEHRISEAEKLWSFQVMAEILFAHGFNTESKKIIQQGLAIKATDIYLLSMYADILLQGNNYQQVIQLLSPHYLHSPLLVRLLIAEKAVGSEKFVSHQQIMKARLQESELLGDRSHSRELSLYLLYVEKNLSAAMELALENWNSQKELADAVLLNASAKAMQDADNVKRVDRWRKHNNISIDIDKLAIRL